MLISAAPSSLLALLVIGADMLCTPCVFSFCRRCGRGNLNFVVPPIVKMAAEKPQSPSPAYLPTFPLRVALVCLSTSQCARGCRTNDGWWANGGKVGQNRAEFLPRIHLRTETPGYTQRPQIPERQDQPPRNDRIERDRTGQDCRGEDAGERSVAILRVRIPLSLKHAWRWVLALDWRVARGVRSPTATATATARVDCVPDGPAGCGWEETKEQWWSSKVGDWRYCW